MNIRYSLAFYFFFTFNLPAQQNYFNVENWTNDTLVFSNLNVVISHPINFNLVRINVQTKEHLLYALSDEDCRSFPILITIGPNIDYDIIIDKNETVVDGKFKSVRYGMNQSEQMIRVDKYIYGVIVYYSSVPESYKLVYDDILDSVKVFINL